MAQNPPSFVPPGVTDSIPFSQWDYAEPNQALLLLDWDDTLFPTNYLTRTEHWPANGVSEDLLRKMQPYNEALSEFLNLACTLSTRCVIVTLATPGWIEQDCIPLLQPSLQEQLRSYLRNGTVRIAYADRHVQMHCARWHLCSDWCKRMVGATADSSERARVRALMAGKQEAMTREATNFYSRYPDQSWKNILSIGDSIFEYIAMQNLGSEYRARGGKERHLRSKLVRTRASPTLASLTLQLRLCQKLLPVLVRFNGCLKLDLQSKHPLERIADDLDMPQMAAMTILRYVWDPAAVARDWDAAHEERFAACLQQVQTMATVRAASFPPTAVERSSSSRGGSDIRSDRLSSGPLPVDPASLNG